MSLVGEYASGLVRVTFAAVPARRALLAAKVAVLTAVMLGFGAIVTGASFWLSQAVVLYELTSAQVNPYLRYPAQPGGEWWVLLLRPPARNSVPVPAGAQDIF